ncbi:MAG: cbb3-type cytochrome oxidase assembly protein CcoS [Bacteroidetes bacterium]|nr:cbb3-type cytochrome oxidase assembly protein CcoS [Bacteroidota bacterium]
MSAMYIMIGASLVLAIGFLIAFIWSVKSNQYEDDYTPSVRVLFDPKPEEEKNEKINSNQNQITTNN